MVEFRTNGIRIMQGLEVPRIMNAPSENISTPFWAQSLQHDENS